MGAPPGFGTYLSDRGNKVGSRSRIPAVSWGHSVIAFASAPDIALGDVPEDVAFTGVGSGVTREPDGVPLPELWTLVGRALVGAVVVLVVVVLAIVAKEADWVVPAAAAMVMENPPDIRPDGA